MAVVIATSAGLLPARLDLTHVLAAYGAGAMLGELVSARWGYEDPATLARRFGMAGVILMAAIWTAVLIGVLR